MRRSLHFSKLRRGLRDLFQVICLGVMVSSMIAQPLAAAGADSTKPGSPSKADQAKWRAPLSKDQKILQLLNRTTFGAQPGDAERVPKMGLNAFLDQQLHPEKIDDAAIDARVAALPTLSMSTEELVENYPQPKPAQILAQQQARAAADAMQAGPSANPRPPRPAEQAQPQAGMMQGPQRVLVELAQEELLRAAYSNRQLQEVMVEFWMNHFNIFAPKGADRWLMTSFERDTIRPNTLGKFEDLLVATAKSPAMLFYLDNWMSVTPNPNYAMYSNKIAPIGGIPRGGTARLNRPFHGPLGGGPFGGPFGRRGGVFGQGPLGNPGARWPGGQGQRPGQQAKPKQQNRRGLNENYAREVMELHTMGVDGGYTQKDVIEVARCLTGWTIDRPQQGGGFIFRPQMHDWSSKVVLDHKIPAGHGIEDGLEVLRLLAHEPSTAHFISLKLCRRFVSDDPPEALVDRAAQTFQKTDGDIRAVLKSILSSKEFYSQAAYRAKVKSPLELVASSIRALGAQTDASVPLIQMIARMGQPMFQYQAPTGFPDRASTWINSGSLLMRINFATQLVANKIPGTQIDFKQPDFSQPNTPPDDVVEGLSTRLVGDLLRPETREAIVKSLAGQNGTLPAPDSSREIATVAGLILASPEFQRR